MNSDNQLNILDVVIIVQMILGNQEIDLIGDINEDGGLNLHFTVRVAQSPTENPFEFEEEFHNVCGDILISCLEKGLRKEDEVDIIYRDNNTKSLAEQRSLQSEGITISEE